MYQGLRCSILGVSHNQVDRAVKLHLHAVDWCIRDTCAVAVLFRVCVRVTHASTTGN